jgi:hypothetical protein
MSVLVRPRGDELVMKAPEFAYSRLHLSIMVFIDLLQSPFQPLQFRLPFPLQPANGCVNGSSHTRRRYVVTEFWAQSVGIREISVSTGRQASGNRKVFLPTHRGDDCLVDQFLISQGDVVPRGLMAELASS